MMKNQRNDIKDISRKLAYNDIIRIESNIGDGDIFNNDNNCILWKNNFSDVNGRKKIFYHLHKRKHLLQKILYYNYVNEIDSKQRIKYKCDNEGLCCTISHIDIT
jgi:hypothetical protein